MDANNIYEVVKKLTGEIDPVGESRTDEIRLENLKTLCGLVQLLIDDVYQVYSRNDSCYESSRKQAAKYAREFLDDNGIHET